jgi:hypothetical protein
MPPIAVTAATAENPAVTVRSGPLSRRCRSVTPTTSSRRRAAAAASRLSCAPCVIPISSNSTRIPMEREETAVLLRRSSPHHHRRSQGRSPRAAGMLLQHRRQSRGSHRGLRRKDRQRASQLSRCPALPPCQRAVLQAPPNDFHDHHRCRRRRCFRLRRRRLPTREAGVHRPDRATPTQQHPSPVNAV